MTCDGRLYYLPKVLLQKFALSCRAGKRSAPALSEKDIAMNCRPPNVNLFMLRCDF